MNDNKDEILEKLKILISQQLGKQKEEESKQLRRNRNFIKRLCKSFDVPSVEYQPIDSFEIIDDYVNSKDRLPRILYSEISINIFSEPDKIGAILTNIDKLTNYVLLDTTLREKEQNSLEAIEIVLKVYDHIHLAAGQIDVMRKSAEKDADNWKKEVEQVKNRLQKEYRQELDQLNEEYDERINSLQNNYEKKAEKAQENYEKKVEKAQQNYVSVLGLFIAILLAGGGIFVQGSAIFTNITKMDFFHLFFATWLVAVILGNFILFFVCFIAKISGIQSETYANWGKQYTKSLGFGMLGIYGAYLIIFCLKH